MHIGINLQWKGAHTFKVLSLRWLKGNFTCSFHRMGIKTLRKMSLLQNQCHNLSKICLRPSLKLAGIVLKISKVAEFNVSLYFVSALNLQKKINYTLKRFLLRKHRGDQNDFFSFKEKEEHTCVYLIAIVLPRRQLGM